MDVIQNYFYFTLAKLKFNFESNNGTPKLYTQLQRII